MIGEEDRAQIEALIVASRRTISQPEARRS
jgi:hypothetical protein